MIEASVFIFGWSVGCWSMWWITKRANERFRHDLIVAAAHLIKQAAQDDKQAPIECAAGADWRER